MWFIYFHALEAGAGAWNEGPIYWWKVCARINTQERLWHYPIPDCQYHGIPCWGHILLAIFITQPPQVCVQCSVPGVWCLVSTLSLNRWNLKNVSSLHLGKWSGLSCPASAAAAALLWEHNIQHQYLSWNSSEHKSKDCYSNHNEKKFSCAPVGFCLLINNNDKIAIFYIYR